METSPEVVVAAEAVRTWVRAQRAGWKAQNPSLAFDAAPAQPVAVPAPPLLPAPVAALFVPEQVANPAIVAAPIADADALSEERAPALPVVTSFAADTPFLGRTWVRAALAAAAVTLLAAGVYVTRDRTRAFISAPKTGTATLASQPQGTQVIVDGQPAGLTPLTLELAAGKHAVEFKLKAATRRQTIDVARGRETAVSVDWNAKALGNLRVEAQPEPARVLVDGRERGTAPLTITDLPVGAHTVQIETAEGSVRRRVEVVEGRTETLTEQIFPGWLHVSSPIEVAVVDGRQPVQLDDSNRALLKPGVHTIRLENRKLEISETRQVTIEPGGTATVSFDPPESTLTVTGATGADVFVDGTKAGQTPLAAFRVKLGAHDVMVVERSGVTRHASITVTARPAQLDISIDR